MIESMAFTQQLVETIAWCEIRVDIANPKWCLRSKALRPDYDYESPDDPTFWNDAQIIQSVIDCRRNLLPISETSTPPTTGLHGGRLLLCFFEETNHNYGSAGESQWFFDGFDNPPWNTWVACIGDALVSWVPPQFLDLAAEGMAVECCQMLMWLEKPLPQLLTKESRQIPPWLTDQFSWK